MTEEKNTSFIIPEEPPVEKDKNKMKNNKKRIRNVSTTLYIWLTIIGIVLIGLGCGISVFELSEYKIANYRAIPMDTSLPQVEKQTITLEASYQNGEQFKLDSNDWHISSYDIQYDNSLKDKVIIEVTAPKDLYHAYLITQNENHYYLQLNEDITGALRFVLQMAKEGYIPENPPPVTLTLTMSEAQAKNFKLNEERYKEPTKTIISPAQ